MKDRWINMGYEDRDLKPFKEPSKDELEPARIGKCCVNFIYLSLTHRIIVLIHIHLITFEMFGESIR